MAKKVLITGSAGLIGSESSKFFANHGFTVYGIDNDMRRYFFGDEASTKWSKNQLEQTLKDKYNHFSVDIRDYKKLEEIFQKHTFDLIIHTAAQPSHDWAAKEPHTDFSVNATGTLNLLELFRIYSPKGVFIFTSTNKVYGDTPNRLPLLELDTRYELPDDHHFYQGVNESMSIDNSKHSIFGASKVAADIMVQEYGKYFGLNTVAFRGGCLTGPAHSGAKLHGFLAYLIKCIALGIPYTIIGYKGKQVRDNIHSYDLVNAFYHFYKKPRKGEVYNIGGSRHSNVSILEAINSIEKTLKKKAKVKYEKKNRSGDHQWYISDVSKFQSHYPSWNYTYNNDDIIEEICRNGHFVQ
jgi:CDP-paratose 2-epimerase